MQSDTRQSVVIVGAGQAGLAAAGAVRAAGGEPVLLEAGSEPVGSWPHFYDSLTLFSPARFSALPGVGFPGDPDRYPRRDEVVDYLRDYAKRLELDIRYGQQVEQVAQTAGGFVVRTAGGLEVSAGRVIAASGGFGTPYRPRIPALEGFGGRVLHAADYRGPGPFAGQRVVVVGAGNSAIQIAIELAEGARVTIASRHPIRFLPQRVAGRDMHFWLTATRLDTAGWARRLLTGGAGTPVFDTGSYAAAIAAGNPDRRPMFVRAAGSSLTFADGQREHVDTVLLATGYRPAVGYLAALGALDKHRLPRHHGGVSSTHAGLGYVGLEWQRSFCSATLRGVGRDAAHVVRQLHRPARR
ncbi:flavin-containing monooxygenase [Actinocatenispora sera]|uniref:Monooxygenase n=1 Tax=Actinocatenispora sera TaxID=390989 RepID=A0A810KWP3_9ACTN|nr:NAD(P)-binding domain-containing protein [Actinocatenispora sera]BCJ27317.1 monooxygenase [Actinocatenispora sera]